MALNKSDSRLSGDLGVGVQGNETMNYVLEKFPIRNRLGENDKTLFDTRSGKEGRAVDNKGFSK